VKKSFRISVMVILAVFVLMVSAVSAADPEPQYGGTFVMTVPSIVHLDVQAINQISSNLWSQMYYETLFDVNDQGKVVPLLVESFDVSDDGLVYNFKLHEGIKFHDGTDFNAEVAKWNFDRKIEKQLPMWNDIPIDKIEVVDAYTLRFTLTQPYAPIFKTLAIKTFGMYSPAFVEKVGDEGLKNEACGTGPFVVDEYIPGEILKLKKNENYWQDGLPYLDAVEIKIIPDNNTRAMMLETGETQMTTDLSFQDISRFESDPNLKIWSGAGSRAYYFSLVNIHPPLDNINVRKAFNHAIDKDSIANVIFMGYASPLRSRLATSALDGFAAQEVYAYDPELAKQMLEAEGLVDTNNDGFREFNGEELELIMWTRKGLEAGDYELAELVQGYLANVGINVRIEVQDNASYLASLNNAPVSTEKGVQPYYDMANLSWGTFNGDVNYLSKYAWPCSAWPTTYWNYSYYCNEEVDKMIDAANLLPTIEERDEAYKTIQKTMWDEASDLYLFEKQSVVVTTSNVYGLYLDAAQTIFPIKWAYIVD